MRTAAVDTPDEARSPGTSTPSDGDAATDTADTGERVPRSRAVVVLDAVGRHRPFVAALAAGALVRAIAVLGFRPAMWFNDAFEYVGVARRFDPYPIRPNGYSAMLRIMEPFHSFALVTVAQHLMGLGIAVMLYALLRHWGLPGWLAALGALPQLLDANQVQLEHVVLSDTLFTILLVGGIVLLAWRPDPSWPITAAAGLLLAGATLTRVVGLPVLAFGLLLLLVWRVGWRPVVAFGAAAALPLLGYAAWFQSVHGQFALSTSDGIFLYSRVAIFADCDKIDPPEDLAVMCEDSDPSTRGDVSSNYLWHRSPLNDIPGTQQEPMLPVERFSADRNGPAGEFARATILAQPIDYLRVGWNDLVRTFQWGREPFPNVTAYSQFPFGENLFPIPDRVFVPDLTARQDTTEYEHGAADTRRIEPFAEWMTQYQRVFAVRGPFLLMLLVAGGVGLVLALRRKPELVWPVALFWGVTMALVVIPPFTAQYDLRYVIPAVPTGGVAAAFAVALVLRNQVSTSPESATSADDQVDGTET